jgi:hypothetical protein
MKSSAKLANLRLVIKATSTRADRNENPLCRAAAVNLEMRFAVSIAAWRSFMQRDILDSKKLIRLAVFQMHHHARIMEAGLTDHVWGMEELIALMPKPTVRASDIERDVLLRALEKETVSAD